MTDHDPRACTPEEFAAERRRAMLAAQGPVPTDPSALPGPPTADDIQSASWGGCFMGVGASLAVVIMLALGFTLGRCTAPEPDTKTRQAVCEVLDQMGADDTDGSAREFCP